MAADSACLIHAFSYASATPNEAKQGNGMHALGESISFGRFMTESLSWEKWSTFSHNKYVEEAERYARPGSVAQKKAFFEAHYRRIAAKKAAAAALLEQARLEEDEEASKADSDLKVGDDFMAGVDSIAEDDAQETVSGLSEDSELGHQMEMERPLLLKLNSKKKDEEDGEEEEVLSSSSSVLVMIKKKRSGLSSFRKIMPSPSSSSIHGKPLNKEVPSSPSPPPPPPPPIVSNVIQTQHHLNTENITITTPTRIPSTPMVRSNGGTNLTGVVDKLPSKSLSSLLNLSDQPAKEPVKLPPPPKKDTSRFAPNSNKNNCSTPLRMTPLAKTEGLAKLYTVTPTSVAASGSKTCSGPKWHYLTSVCSKSLTACRNKLCSPSYTMSSTTTPFRLRTEERAARRKQKLEEKFNANVEEEVHKKGVLQTKVKVHQEEKPGTELRRKLGRSFCFKARPLPDFYHHKHQADDKTEEAPSPPLKHQTSKNHGKQPPQPVKKLGKNGINMPVAKAGVRKKS
ncbi:unnamed protein product [Cuscuta epithymum]|uniref:TPX2 C-terminal domain-containing protein n=2 Tax=Cuscuta epithymum TaxID=186058 RepID=A0AAV0D814_9ASTE|nr:unnamed protein product [Cuscuta epithymum]